MSATAGTRTQPIDLDRSAVARYLQLATLFRRRIETGEWPVGVQIPTVEALSLECGVARLTIRQALDQLENDSLIARFRAKGTFVKSRPPSKLWCEVGTDWSGMLLARDGARIEVLSSRARSALPPGAGELGNAAPAYRHLRRRHWRDGIAFLLADVFIESQVAKLIPAKAYTTKTALKLIADAAGVKIIDARQTLTIATADIETSALLQIPLNAPVAHVRRIAIDARGNIALLANGIYRGDIVHLEMKLK